ncbi:glycosyltransferase family 4 protein [Pontibacter flavimaris]|nr:glycosyltransferase family 1 protein [Pontibacter flavimaris]
MSPTYKILVVDARMVNASGIGTDIQNLLPYLKNNFAITLLGDPEELMQFPWVVGLKIIKFDKPIYSIAEQVLLPLVVPTCDFFFSPHFNVPMLPVRAAKRVVLIHDLYHLAATAINPIHRLYARVLLQSSIRLSDTIITISEFSRSEMKKYLKIRNKQVHKISLGVDHNRYHRKQDAAVVKEVQEKYTLPAEFVLFVGNVKPHKNLKNLVLAFSKLNKAQFPDLKLVIVGKKEGFITGDKGLPDLIEKLGLGPRVLFTGFVDNAHLPVIYTLATVFVFPSLYEGFGLPPLEAMASGCPTVVSKAASMPEVCQDACLYFDGENPDDMAETLDRVLQDAGLRETLAKKGLELAKQYTWEKSAAELRDFILHH